MFSGERARRSERKATPEVTALGKEKLALEERCMTLRKEARILLAELTAEVFTQDFRHKLPLSGDARGDIVWPLYFRTEYIIERLGFEYEQGSYDEKTREYRVRGGGLRLEEEALYDPGYDDDGMQVIEKRSVRRRLDEAESIEELEELKANIDILDKEFSDLQEETSRALSQPLSP